jgi:hypothetical protein
MSTGQITVELTCFGWTSKMSSMGFVFPNVLVRIFPSKPTVSRSVKSAKFVVFAGNFYKWKSRAARGTNPPRHRAALSQRFSFRLEI